VAQHGVVGAGMLDGGVEFVFDAGDGLEQELAQVSEGVGGLVRDALFGQGGEDFAEDLVYVGGPCVELAGKGKRTQQLAFRIRDAVLLRVRGGCRKRDGLSCGACGRCGRRRIGGGTWLLLGSRES